MFARLLTGVITLFISVAACAETVVLVHGYHNSGDSWRYSGVAHELMINGFQDGGHLITTPLGMVALNGQKHESADQFITIDLPSEAPLMVQARLINDYLSYIREKIEPGELTMVGFSAGGVAARLAIVMEPIHRVSTLITIASPHLGTALSELGVIAGQSPASWFLPMVGAESVNRSQGLFYDLSREQTGNILFWLNRQPHPRLRYVSIVRPDGGFLDDGDWVVSPISQDMNQIPTLAGRSELVFSRGNHTLNRGDGYLIAQIVNANQP